MDAISASGSCAAWLSSLSRQDARGFRGNITFSVQKARELEDYLRGRRNRTSHGGVEAWV